MFIHQIKMSDKLESLKEPYKVMGGMLKSLDRDFVFNMGGREWMEYGSSGRK